MVSIKEAMVTDPTLLAADRALEAEAAASPYRTRTLAMSQIGGSCQRKSWYDFRWAFREVMDHVSLKRFADGYSVEELAIKRLKMVAGVQVQEKDPRTGKQFVYLDQDGHAKGKCDGKIIGILQAPKKLHILEIKATEVKKLAEFRKAKMELGEKMALKKWNETYYAQAQLYMFYEGTDRHYCVICSPGLRDWDSCRTDLDMDYVNMLRSRMSRVIKSNEPLDRAGNGKPDWWECKNCKAFGICHEKEMPDRSCRTCLHSTPVVDGQWHCERWGKILTPDQQQLGCPAHKFLPALVPGEVTAATTATAVHYKMHDGTEWVDGEGEDVQSI